MATLSAEQVAQLAYQAGFRGEDLVNIVAIAKRESGYRTDAHRTDRDPALLSGDMGLWQINYSNWGLVSSRLGLTSKSQLFDPLVNAQAAFVLYQASGNSLQPWSMGPNGWTASGNPLYGTNVDAARAAVNSAQQSGLLGQQYAGAGSVAANAGATAGTGSTAPGSPITLPSDTTLATVNGQQWALYDVGGVNIAYTIDPGLNVNTGTRPVQQFSAEQWTQMGVVNAGSVAELATVEQSFGNFRSFWDSIMSQVMGSQNPARNDPEVLRVIAEFAARPDMSELELQNKLQATEWFRTRTTAELEWNGLADGEKQKRREETSARMAATIEQFLGVRVEAGDPRIQNYLEDVASGKMGFGAFTEVIKSQALGVEESPYFRDRRAEEEAQRQRPIDIENTSQQIRDTLRRWGVDMRGTEVTRWAKEIVEKRKSDQDLLDTIKQMAAVLYPWKDPEMETITAAEPWLATYDRVMERSGSIQTPQVAAALTAGQPVWEFEQGLKKTDGWLATRNGRTEMIGVMSEAGRRMGFV